jgi:phthiocerol/phenolphthiocerol synthesis type-I polyketide synthase C
MSMAGMEDVAIVGYGGRLPGACSVDGLWSLLRQNKSSVGWITPDRFPTSSLYHPSKERGGRAYTFAAGLIDDIWGFDASAFGMSPREGEQVDPQQRHLLEVTQDALAHAGIRPSSLAGSGAGVYVGASSVDYGARFFADPSAADVHMMTGNTLSIIANRLSYNLDLHGPSFTVDTACSSSLVALNLAAEAIRAGIIETAIVGGVNLLLSPFSFVGFSRASMLSPTGRCRPFDAAADGYVRAEGAIVLVLRSMASARKARNRIHATIVGSGVGQDGRTTGLSVPSAASQRQLLEQVYGDFGIDPSELAFVEAHGTGTKVGDPVEADALGKGLAQRRSQPLPIGSVKSNIGHLEPASGLAGVLKSILALNHGVLPATLHQATPNPNIPFGELNLKVVDRNWTLPERRGPALAGVNSFGFGGTNAHVVLRGEDTTVAVAHPHREESPPPLLLSAYAQDLLPTVAQRHLEAWPTDKRLVGEFIVAAAHLRDPLPHRALVRAPTAAALRQQLDLFAAGHAAPGVLSGHALGQDLPVAFVFSGNGAQWAGMGRAAWHSNPRFREALQEIDGHFLKQQKTSLVDLMFADDLAPRLRRATHAQPLLLALQMATVRSLEAQGLTPQATLGHSVGEIAAAWCAGALSLEQAIDVVIARSRHQETVRGSGCMAALMLGEREARRFLKPAAVPDVDLAAINSWRSVTVSGPVEGIEQVLALAAEQRIGARRLDLDYPFHSALVDPVRAPLMRELRGLRPLKARRQFISSVTGALAEGEGLGPDHWWHNVRDPVQFEAGLAQLIKQGMQVFVEVGPKPILGSYLRDALREANLRGAIIETLAETGEDDDSDPIERAVARVMIAGGQIDSERLFGLPPVQAMPLPAYPWRHTAYQVRPTAEAGSVFQPPSNPLLGSRPRLDASEWFSTVDPVLFPWIADHKVGGLPVFPAAGYVEVLMAAAREVHGDSALELREMDIVRPLVFDGNTTCETLVRLAAETGIVEFLSRPRGVGADWAINARGIVSRSPVSERKGSAESESGRIIVPRAKVYEISRTLGFEYGPSFQRVRHVSFPEAKRAMAALELNTGVAIAGQTIDITALDAAFHSLFAAEEAGVADMPMKRMLPVRFGRVRAFAPGTMACRTVARTRRQSLSSMVTDIELYDEAGRLVLLAEGVRLIEAPVATGGDAQSLAYRTTHWRQQRPGEPSVVTLRGAGAQSGTVAEVGVIATGEALLLLEAGCLRVAWEAFQGGGAGKALQEAPPPAETDPEWPAYLCSSLLWHLETKGLVVERNGVPTLAESCNLPPVRSIVRSLLSRHPTMAVEAAGLSRISEVVGRLVAGDARGHSELNSAHWRQLDAASRQISLLRSSVVERLRESLEEVSNERLLRVLVIGADHAQRLAEFFTAFPNVYTIVTDLDPDRLEQARAALGDDAARLQCLAWSELDTLAAGTVDLAAVIDALSEVAATIDGLERLRRVLRPQAPVLAGEPAPSVFWDIVRGVRPSWWVRSANSDFPVGALLTREEWIDELTSAGFTAVAGDTILGDASIGVVLSGLAHGTRPTVESVRAGPSFRWEGAGSVAAQKLQQTLLTIAPGEAEDAKAEAMESASVIWTVEGSASDKGATAVHLGHLLAEIAERCARLAAHPAPLWVVVTLDATASDGPGSDPLWCALTSALRVAQNEYPALEIRVLGLADITARTLAATIDELLSPTEEREIYLQDGERTVIRVDHVATSQGRRPAPDSGVALRLASRTGSSRGALAWNAGPRAPVGPGEVEITIAAVGLNFRDVMWNLGLLPEEALEDGYTGAHLGMECAGTISAVGPDVEGLAVGDKVVAFVAGGFASHVVAPAFAVSPLPAGLTQEAAATLPVAFMTAYYSLVHLANLKRGETVLVHGGAGAVGLAALQVARMRGARLIATAGSEEKRALLRDLGADVVLNSRTLAFADEVAAETQGHGVDVVLNSLAGEAMIRSMDCLRPFGRFVELGKRDFYANTHLGLRPFRRNLSYFGVDIDQLIVEHHDLTQRLFGELVALFARGELMPLPYCVFEGERIGEAFQLMRRSGHIGKIVIRPATSATDAAAAGRFPVDAAGQHVVIGGTSGFGLASAGWLASRGATQLVLASRSGQLSHEARLQVEALRQAGVDVRVAAVDVTDAPALQRLLRSLAARGPIKGIVHAAMVLDDRLIANMDREAIDKVLQPKVTGALHLTEAARDLSLDYLLFYSSATTLLGNPGQFNYVAANGFLEGLAQQGRLEGLPTLAAAWGGIEDAGYLSRNLSANASLRKRFASSMITAEAALAALDLACDTEGRLTTATLAIARIDWGMAHRELAVMRAPSFSGVIPAARARQSTSSAATLEKLKLMSIDQASEALLEVVVEEIARVLRLPAKEVDRHRPLAEIGMDSLMMLELRSTVEDTLRVDLPIMSLANGVTPADVARRIAALVVGDGNKGSSGGEAGSIVTGALAALSASHVAGDVEAMAPEAREAGVRAVMDRTRRLEGPL